MDAEALAGVPVAACVGTLTAGGAVVPAAYNGAGKAAIMDINTQQHKWRLFRIFMRPTVSEPIALTPFVLYQSTLLNAYAERVIHGFTGKPLTLGGAAFSPEEVQAARRAVCEHAGLDYERLVLPRQTHTDLALLNDLPCADEADAVILTQPGLPAMVQVADCVPVILYDPERHVGAVVHSGWKGTAQSITVKVARRLIEEHGARADRMVAVIGPSIGGCCYEVSQEVADAVGKTIPGQPVELYQTQGQNGKPLVDLKWVNCLQLEHLGVERIEIIDACTQCLPETLWSYRRQESGRQVAFLQLL